MDRQRFSELKTIPLLFAAALLAGCYYEDHDHHHDHPVVVEDRRPVVVEEHREVREVQPRVRHERTLIVEGRHFIEFRAPHHGTAFVADVERGEDIVNVEMRPNDHLTVDPDKNKVYLNGKKIYDHDLKSKHLFRIYFTEHR